MCSTFNINDKIEVTFHSSLGLTQLNLSECSIGTIKPALTDLATWKQCKQVVNTANSCLFIHSEVTEQHYDLFGVVLLAT